MPVVGFDIKTQRVLAYGKSWGDVGPYEELLGTLHFASDPENDSNSRITDIGLAPRNEEGQVGYTSDVSVILPVDRTRGSGKMLLDVVNRGNRVGLPVFNSTPRVSIEPDTPVDYDVDLGNGFLMRHGYTVVAHNRTIARVDEFLAGEAQGTRVIGARSSREMIAHLKRPRRVMLLVKAGQPVDETIEKLLPHLAPGAIIIDAGNSL